MRLGEQVEAPEIHSIHNDYWSIIHSKAYPLHLKAKIVSG